MTVEMRVPTALERMVLETLAYSDVFDYPLTAEEVHRALPHPATLQDVTASLEGLGEHVTAAGPYFALAGRAELVATRERRGAASRALVRRADAYGRVIAALPFVRMVGLTGSLAVDNAEAGDDVDYLVVTAPGRVWLARAMTMLVVRFAALRGLMLCPNYILAESALVLPQRDLYTARELLQTRPIAGEAVFDRMLRENAWCRGLLPNWEVLSSRASPRPAGFIKRIGEKLLGGRLGNAIERRLLRRKAREFAAQAAGNSETEFDERVCKGHFDGHRARLESELARRLAGLGLPH